MKQLTKLVTALQILALLFTTSSVSHAGAPERFATVESAGSGVSYQRQGATEWAELHAGDRLIQGDKIKSTEAEARLLISGNSPSTVDVRPATEMTLASVATVPAGDDTELQLLKGSVLVKSEKLKGRSRFEVKTPNSVVGIRGTVFEVNVD